MTLLTRVSNVAGSGHTLLATNKSRTPVSLHRVQAGHTAYGYGTRYESVGFCGEYCETHVGYLFGAGYRAYSPTLMRFFAPDVFSPFLRGGINAYAYCGAEPINRVDRNGQAWSALFRGLRGETTEALLAKAVKRRAQVVTLTDKMLAANIPTDYEFAYEASFDFYNRVAFDTKLYDRAVLSAEPLRAFNATTTPHQVDLQKWAAILRHRAIKKHGKIAPELRSRGVWERDLDEALINPGSINSVGRGARDLPPPRYDVAWAMPPPIYSDVPPPTYTEATRKSLRN